MTSKELLALLIIVSGVVACTCFMSSCTATVNTEYYKYKTDVDRAIAEKGGVIFRSN